MLFFSFSIIIITCKKIRNRNKINALNVHITINNRMPLLATHISKRYSIPINRPWKRKLVVSIDSVFLKSIHEKPQNGSIQWQLKVRVRFRKVTLVKQNATNGPLNIHTVFKMSLIVEQQFVWCQLQLVSMHYSLHEYILKVFCRLKIVE